MKLIYNLFRLKNQILFIRKYSNEIRKEFEVSKYGVLSVDHKGPLNVSSINPIKYPDQTKAHLRLQTDTPSQNFKEATYDVASSTLTVNTLTNNIHATYKIDVDIPLKYEVKINSFGGPISIRDLENDFIHSTLNDAPCKLSNLKTNKIDIKTNNGDIESSKTLHANGNMLIEGKGDVKINKIVGEHMRIEVEEGDIEVKSLYVVRCELSVGRGAVRLGQVHQSVNVNVKEEGSIDIDSLDGDLVVRVAKGDVSVFASEPKNIDIVSEKGDITLSLSENHKLSTHSIHLSPHHTHLQLLHQNDVYKGIMSSKNKDGKASNKKLSLKATNGKVVLSVKDWAETFLKKKLMQKSDIE